MASKPTRPRPTTSTSAFRTYLKTADELGAAVELDDLTPEDAWFDQQKACNVLIGYLCEAFHARLTRAQAKKAEAPRIETYPVPQLRDLGQPRDDVNRRRDQGAAAGSAGPAAPDQVVANHPPADLRPGQRPPDPPREE